MNKKTFLTWVTVFIASFVLDSIVHMGITGGYSREQLQGVLKPMSQVNFMPLFLEYIIVTTGIVYFLIQTNAKNKSLSYAFKLGALIGLMVYGIYGLINGTLLLQWSWNVVLLDALTGVIVMAISATLGRLVLGSQKK